MGTGNSKLTTELVRAIREQGRQGRSAPKIARELRLVTDIVVGVETIRRVLRGETWTEMESGMEEAGLEAAAQASLAERMAKDIQKVKEGDKMIDELKGGEDHDAGYE